MSDNSPSIPTIILVSLALTLAAVSFIMNMDNIIKINNYLENPRVEVVYKDYVPITAMTLDALSVVAVVELVGEYDEQTLLGLKFRVRNIISKSFAENQKAIEEKLEALSFIKKANVMYTTIVVRGEKS